VSNEIVKRLEELKKLLSDKEIAKEGFKFFRSKTPVLSGNARRKTFLNGTTIEADYPYARRLDDGYSKKAKDGMTEPTIDHLKKWIEDKSKG
jgi:hypothetical protein